MKNEPKIILFFHNKRAQSKFTDSNSETHTIYHDNLSRNQDPYIWNKNFLYSFCKMKNISPSNVNVNDIIYFIEKQTIHTQSGNKTKFKCDLVFCVKQKFIWEQDKNIPLKNLSLPHVDKYTYFNHYYWTIFDHIKPSTKPNKRFTFVANEDNSFQPHDKKTRILIDVTKEIEQIFKHKTITTSTFNTNEVAIQEFQKKINNEELVHKFNGEYLEQFREKITSKSNSNFIDALDFEYELKSIQNLIQKSPNKDFILLKLVDHTRKCYDYILLAIENIDTLSNESIQQINMITSTRHYFVKPIDKTTLKINKGTITNLTFTYSNKDSIDLRLINVAFINFTRDITLVNEKINGFVE